MSQSSSMKLIGSRMMGCVVTKMQWSNKMDLIAFGTDQGEVIIQRLNWQKIITFPSQGEGVSIRSLAWQFDESVLAVGYSNGHVVLLDAERENELSTLDFEEDIKSVFFSKLIKTADYRGIYRNRPEHQFDFFLPQLPQLSGIVPSSKSIEEQKLYAKSSPCFLVIVTGTGKVQLILLGAMRAGFIDVAEYAQYPDEVVVHDIQLNYEFDSIYILISDRSDLKLLHFQNKILRKYLSPLLHLSVHCANILETKSYINDTIQSIIEAWETVLLEMDNKLTKYANQQPEGVLAADFLELLVFGYASNDIEDFLRDELTEKGLKKLANSVDLSYSTIESLVTKPLQSGSINMFYFLNTLKGLSKIHHFFEPLLKRDAAEVALRLCGSFLMKVLEMQQIIEQSVNDMKLFFSWLCIVIIRLYQGDVPEEMTEITPEDTIYLAEYFNSFDESILENGNGTVTKRKFNLKKFGQYLENENLQQIPKSEVHHLWKKLLEENACLQCCPLLYPHEKEYSLIQQRDKMFDAIEEVFKRPNDSITTGFKLDAVIVCNTLSPAAFSTKQDWLRSSFYVNDKTQSDLLVTTIGCSEALLLEFDKPFELLKYTRLILNAEHFSKAVCDNSFNCVRFVDLKFYNEGTLSLLLENSSLNTETSSSNQCFFLQFAVDTVKTNGTLHIMPSNISLIDNSAPYSVLESVDRSVIKYLEGQCTHLAVSGMRKVVAILSEQQRKMNIFEMEIEDDEEETEMSQNSLLELSKESAASSTD